MTIYAQAGVGGAVEPADLIERFVNGRVEPYEWEFDDPFIERLRLAVLMIPETFPSLRNEYCSDEGAQQLLQIAAERREALNRA